VDGPAAFCAKVLLSTLNQEPSMSEITRIAIDTSKSVFTLHGVNATRVAVLRRNLQRAGKNGTWL
jgi:hypothetical protein